MPVNKEVADFLLKTFSALVEELAEELPESPQSSLIYKEAEYITKKAWTTDNIAGHIAIKYGTSVSTAGAVVPMSRKKKSSKQPQHSTGKKRKLASDYEHGQPVPKKHRPFQKRKLASRKPQTTTQQPRKPQNRLPRSRSGKQRNKQKPLAQEASAMETETMLRELEKIPYFRDPTFKSLFHMERSTFQALCEMVGFKVAGRTVSPYSKLLGVLWWLAGRESMKQIVKRFDWSIGTFHGAVHLFSTAIVEHLMPQTIRWPAAEEDVKSCLLSFEQNYNFQGVMGCLGACRLPLRLRSAKRGAPYRDPNGHPSILLQAVCDANRRFLHVSAGWPGTTAEFAAFHESDLPGLLDKLPDYAQILASRDYPARNHVWIPFNPSTPITDEMFYFNRLHTSTMVALTRTTTLLKNTFQRLELLEMLPDKIPSVVLAACALINFILDREEVVCEERFPVMSGSGFDGVPGSGATGGKKKKSLAGVSE